MPDNIEISYATPSNEKGAADIQPSEDGGVTVTVWSWRNNVIATRTGYVLIGLLLFYLGYLCVNRSYRDYRYHFVGGKSFAAVFGVGILITFLLGIAWWGLIKQIIQYEKDRGLALIITINRQILFIRVPCDFTNDRKIIERPRSHLIAITGHLDFYDKHFQIAIDIKGRRPLLLLRGLSATVVEELNDVLNKAMAATG